MREIFPKDSLFLTEDKRSKRWAVPYNHEALNDRCENLLCRNQKYIKNQRVLDLGCHFGSMAYAALDIGASYVCGIDSEEKLINQGKDLFQKHNVAIDKYDFEVAEVYKYLEYLEEDSFDTILCFGLFYYLSDPIYALKLMKKVAKKAIILDTFTAYYLGTISKESRDVVDYTKEETFQLPFVFYSVTQAKKLDYALKEKRKRKNKKPLSFFTLPTESALCNFFMMLGLEHKKLNWNRYVQNDCTWRDLIPQEGKEASHWADIYHSGIRVSYVLTK